MSLRSGKHLADVLIPAALTLLCASSLSVAAYAAGLLDAVIATVCDTGECPVLLVDSPRRDLGVVHYGDVVHASFQLRNPGHRGIRIVDVRSGCGCTAALPDDHTIGANGTTLIRTKLRVETARVGPIEKTVTVAYALNAPPDALNMPPAQLATVTLYLLADVHPAFTAEPRQLEFRWGVPATASLKYTFHTGDGPGIKKMHSTHECIAVQRIEPNHHTNTWEVELSFDPSKLTNHEHAFAELCMYPTTPYLPVHRTLIKFREETSAE